MRSYGASQNFKMSVVFSPAHCFSVRMEKIDMTLTCFKAYDIRGKLGEELNEDIVYRIGRAYAVFLRPETVVVGGDVRLTSNALKNALSNGLRDEGVDVIDIGMCGTE